MVAVTLLLTLLTWIFGSSGLDLGLVIFSVVTVQSGCALGDRNACGWRGDDYIGHVVQGVSQ